MDLFSRYVFKQVLNALVMILGSLTAIVWIATSLKQVENLSGGGTWLFFQMTSLAMPQAMAIVTPFALLIACLYSLHKLNTDSELIVMTASGATVWRFIRPYALLGLLISSLVLFSNVFVQPASLQKLREFIMQVRTDLIQHVLEPGKFSNSSNELTFHIRDRSDTGNLLGLLVNDTRDPKQSLTYLAEEGELIKLEGRAYLKMTNGHIHRKQAQTDGVQIVKFDQYVFDLSEFGKDEGKAGSRKPKERYIHELTSPTAEDMKNEKLMGRIRAELHDRFASALYPLVFALIAVATLGVARSTRQKSSKLLVYGFCAGLMVRMLGLAVGNMHKVNPNGVWLVYGVPLLAILGALLYIWISMNPQARSRFERLLPRLPKAPKLSRGQKQGRA